MKQKNKKPKKTRIESSKTIRVSLNHLKMAQKSGHAGKFTEAAIEEKHNGGLIGKLKKDPELFETYKSNIAMSYIDNERWYREKTGKKVLNQSDKHTVANNAAKYFLELLIK